MAQQQQQQRSERERVGRVGRYSSKQQASSGVCQRECVCVCGAVCVCVCVSPEEEFVHLVDLTDATNCYRTTRWWW